MRGKSTFLVLFFIPKRTRGAEATGRFYSRVSAGKERYQYPDPWVGKGRFASRVQGLPWGLIPFIVGLVFLTSSCDLFFGLPRLRENPDDWGAQLSSLAAVAHTVDSAALRFVWRQQAEWFDDYQELNEVSLVWSKNEYPVSPVPSFLNGYEGATISSTGYHSQLITSLSPGETIYAALFGKNQKGWNAPRYAKIKIPSSFSLVGPITDIGFSDVFECYVDYDFPDASSAYRIDTSVLPTSINIHKDGIGKRSFLIYFDLPLSTTEVVFSQADLKFTATGGLLVKIYPILFRWQPDNVNGVQVYDVVEELIKDSSLFTSHTLAANNIIDLTGIIEVSSTSLVYGFLIEPAVIGTDAIDIDAVPSPAMDISYFE